MNRWILRTGLSQRQTTISSSLFMFLFSLPVFSWYYICKKGHINGIQTACFRFLQNLYIPSRSKTMASDTLQLIQCSKVENKSGISSLVYLFLHKIQKTGCLINPIEVCILHCLNEQYAWRREICFVLTPGWQACSWIMER